MSVHDDVIKGKHSRGLLCGELTGHWRGDLVFSLICAWTNNCARNEDAGDLRCHHAHYNVFVMLISFNVNVILAAASRPRIHKASPKKYSHNVRFVVFVVVWFGSWLWCNVRYPSQTHLYIKSHLNASEATFKNVGKGAMLIHYELQSNYNNNSTAHDTTVRTVSMVIFKYHVKLH